MHQNPTLCEPLKVTSNTNSTNLHPIKTPFYLMKRSTNQNVKFMRKWIPFHKYSLKMEGEIKRSQYRKTFQNISKTGHCDLKFGHLTNPSEANLIYKDISKIRNLQHLHLQFHEYSPLNNKKVMCIVKAIKTMKNLRSLKIIFDRNEGSCDHSVKALIVAISKCSFLEDLDLRFLSFSDLSERAYSQMSLFKRLERLKSFSICLTWNHGLTERTLQKIEDMFSSRRNKQLQTFRLSLFNYNFNSTQACLLSLGHICEHAAHLEKLENVQLNIPGWTTFSFNSLAKSLEKLTKIKSLDLNLAGSQSLSSQDLQDFCYALKSMTGLQNLSLNLGHCGKIKEYSSIESLIGHLKGLLSLSLNFFQVKGINDNDLEGLSNRLRKLSDLKSLKLCFEGCNDISDKGIMKVIEAIRQNVNLEIIKIEFPNKTNLLNLLFKSLDENAFKFKNLKSLAFTFKFDRSCSLERFSFKKIARLFAPIPSLLHLSLDVPIISQMDDFALGDLSESLKNLKNLISLNLSFHSCGIISSEGLKTLSDAILSMQMLESLGLELIEGPKIDDEGVIGLCNAVKKLNYLRSLTISMTLMELITTVGLDALYQLMVQSKSLSVVDFDLSECSGVPFEEFLSFQENVERDTKINEVNIKWVLGL